MGVLDDRKRGEQLEAVQLLFSALAVLVRVTPLALLSSKKDGASTSVSFAPDDATAGRFGGVVARQAVSVKPDGEISVFSNSRAIGRSKASGRKEESSLRNIGKPI